MMRISSQPSELWTVSDTTFSKLQHHRHAHCHEAAIARVFVNAAGVKRSYAVKRNESRTLDTAQLERQLREASFVGELPDMSKRTPR